MLEVLLCSLVTVLPDYLYRYYRQGKRLGREITLYSVWYELRYGITACLMLTVALITVIFYYHPSTSMVTAMFRTVPILPETNGRVSEVYIGLSGEVEQGAPLFRLDDTKQKAALDLADKRIAEVDAALAVAKVDIIAAEGQIQQAKSAYQEAVDDLAAKETLFARNPGVVRTRDLEQLRAIVEGRKGAVIAAEAAKQAAETRIATLLPAERASAEAARQQAQIDLDKTLITAGIKGRVEQFVLRPGDIVNPFMRPAGVLVPADAGRRYLVAGFNQIESHVIKPGMIAEAACISKPWTVIPMVVAEVQGVLAAGQVRTSDQLLDAQQVVRPGTLTVLLRPLYEDGLEGVPPGSSCIANAYTSNHEELERGEAGLLRWLFLHVVDTVSVVHAGILRSQTLLLPIKLLVFSGGH